MKKIFFFFLLIFSLKIFAGTCVVIVLEAPLFEKEDKDSRLVTYARKGDKLFIHDKYNHLPRPSFFYVVTSNGTEGFIPSEYVKRILKDDREDEEPIHPFAHDPTDYRLNEPLPENYPLLKKNQYRALALFSFGAPYEFNYPYPSNIQDSSYTFRRGIELIYLKTRDNDRANRFYFGLDFRFHQQDTKLTTVSSLHARESLGQFSFGPYISYDLFRNENFRIVFNGSSLLTWNRDVINLKGTAEEENRIFSTFGLTSYMGGQLQFIEVFPHVDIIVGTHLSMNFPMKLSPSAPPENATSWNSENDKIEIPMIFLFEGSLGLQVRY